MWGRNCPFKGAVTLDMRFYLDTSVFSGLFDEEFREDTIGLFDYIRGNNTQVIYTDVLEEEL